MMNTEEQEKRRIQISLSEAVRTDQYWMWVDDGYDNPESLVCPILIHADIFRRIMQEQKEAGKAEGRREAAVDIEIFLSNLAQDFQLDDFRSSELIELIKRGIAKKYGLEVSQEGK